MINFLLGMCVGLSLFTCILFILVFKIRKRLNTIENTIILVAQSCAINSSDIRDTIEDYTKYKKDIDETFKHVAHFMEKVNRAMGSEIQNTTSSKDLLN